MKKFLTLLALLNISVFSQPFTDSIEVKTEPAKKTYNEVKKVDLMGFVLQLSFLNYFNAGLGLNFGDGTIIGSHGWSEVYGFLVECNTKEELHLRLYYNKEGGSALLLWGASAMVVTDFDKKAVGIAPHIGLSLLYYRYNIYTKSKFNRHELVLFPIYLF